MSVHGIQFEVHRTRQGERDTDAVEDITIGEDSDVDIVDEDVVEVPSLLITEEGVRHPDLLGVSEC